jgi:hypothetical protein
MRNRRLATIDAQQALSFMIGQATHIEAQVYQIKYPEIQYPELIPVDTSANEWTRSITFFSSDKVGKAEWFHHTAKDMPRADVVRSRYETMVEMAGIGYGYTLEEIGYAMLIPGSNLNTDRAAAARRAYEEFMDDLALRGSADKNLTGLFNDPNVSPVNVAADGAGGLRTWASKTPAQILRDFNLGLIGVQSDTKTVEMADTVLIPVDSFQYLASTQNSSASDVTILEYLKRANVYTATTGQQLTIRAVRGLETAGASGTRRMITYRRSPEVLKLHLPMPHRFLPVWQDGPIQFEVPGIFRTGGLEIRLPKAVRYHDGM